MKKLFCILIVLCHQITKSQNTIAIPSKRTHKGFLAMDFLSIDMPTNNLEVSEDPMVFSGIHYNLSFNTFYSGIGMYGAVRGARGGFFTLGINAGFTSYLSEKLFVDTGIHFGGGGGASAPDGGGAFILPHLDLGIQFNKFSLTTGYSYINFFDGGGIKSHQLHLALRVPVELSSASLDDAEKTFTVNELRSSVWNKQPGKASFMLHLNNLFVEKGQQLTGKTIRLAGFEFNSYIDTKWFYFVKFDGAYNGIKAGYMNVLLGAGYHFSFNKNKTNILTKFGMGAGGGGGVDSQGGFLIYPDLSVEQHISNNIYFSINKGLLMSPNSYFKTSTVGIGLKYYSNINGISRRSSDDKVIFKGVEAILKQDVYFDAKRIEDPTENMHQISLQFNYHVSKNIYLAGQTSFANFGNAGAYAEGVVGVGMQSNYFINNTINLFIQGLVGGAGGGGISTGEGLIIKPSMGIHYHLNSELALRSSIGYVKAKAGELSSPFFNLGISYRLSFLTAKQ